MPKVWWFVFAYNAKYDKKCFFKRQVGTQPGWHLVTNKCFQKWKRNATKHMNQPKLLYLKCKWFNCFVPHSFTILKLGLKWLVVIEEWNCSQMWCLVLLLVESTWIIISMHNHLASLRTHFSVAKCSNGNLPLIEASTIAFELHWDKNNGVYVSLFHKRNSQLLKMPFTAWIIVKLLWC